MKRRIEETVKTADTSGCHPHSLSPLSLSPSPNRRTLTTQAGQSTYAPTIKASSELRTVQNQSTGFSTFATTMPAVTSSTMPAVTSSTKVLESSMSPPVPGSPTVTSAQQQQQIQRLKVEDALSYLDMVKFKFGGQPQVYNEFLDIMKEFKSHWFEWIDMLIRLFGSPEHLADKDIDTPTVIDRVSSLFKGHPELIVGFNTFLPPGYKIEVKTNQQGYSFQVQVSMPSSSTATTTLVPAAPTVYHTTQTPNTALPTPTSVVMKPLILKNTAIVTNSNSAAAVVAVVPPVPSTPPPPVPSTPPPPVTQVQAHQAVFQALSHVNSTQTTTQQSQPVEFNHAINYVNKIKNRFQGQPDKYKRFLEILHTYQKEQHNLKEGSRPGNSPAGTKQLTEADVYSQVAKLFEHQEDLLAEFGQFLPDATNHQTQLARRCEEPSSSSTTLNRKPTLSLAFNNSTSASPSPVSVGTAPPAKMHDLVHVPIPPISSPHVEPSAPQGLKRSLSMTQHHTTPSTSQHVSPHPPPKKHKYSSMLRDISPTDAAKYGSLTDFAFFDKVRKAIHSQDVYDNFLRCLNLYIQEIVSGPELLQMITPFLARFPELFRWFREYTGLSDRQSVQHPQNIDSPCHNSNPSCDSMLNNINRAKSEIDFASCKRLGASYCALPEIHQREKCSGRNSICREVLNDTWVSFPTWSEESTFVTSRKTQYEEYIYRCEDERFELDLVLEVNAATIRALEGVHKKLCHLSMEEVAKFHLDDTLGGKSTTIHQRALSRVYGDKAPDIIDGLKKNPVVAVPVVLRRLKAKEEEWREAQKSFNKIWREQNEKYYLKSLDHQGINFKQNDMKALRSKSLLNEIETCCDERHELAESGDVEVLQGPHITLLYRDKSVLDDAANLLIHHVKRQTGIHKKDKQRIKHMIRQLLPDFFHHPHQELSEDERDTQDGKIGSSTSPNSQTDSSSSKPISDDKSKEEVNEDVRLPTHPEEEYTLFFGNSNWYLFLRLHQILCERLTHIYEHANVLIKEEAKYKELRSEATAIALRLKPRCEYLIGVEVEDYYSAFLDMVKNLLDGNMDANAYEDTLREMFGIHAYLAFTLDKVVIYAVRQLQHLVADEACTECVDLYMKAHSRGGAGGLSATANTRVHAEAAYQHKAELALADENCFKMLIYKVDCKLTIELLDSEGDENEVPAQEVGKWSAYVDRYAKTTDTEKDDPMDVDEEGESEQDRRPIGKAIFLPRNMRLWHTRAKNKGNASKMDASDDTECKFNLNSYKMVFVLDCESYLYKRQSLLRARQTHKQLSGRKSVKFHEWHQHWSQNHVTPQQRTFANNWMLGALPDYKAHKTIVHVDNPLDKPPYHVYKRYRVHLNK